MKILNELKTLFKRRRRIVAKEIDSRRKQCVGTVIKNYADGGVLVRFKTGGWFAPTWEHSISAGMLAREYIDAPQWNFSALLARHKTCSYILPGIFGNVERETDILIIQVGVKYLDFVGVLKFWRC